MIQATNSPKLNREQRLNLLENSVKLFQKQLNYIKQSSTTDLFTPSFSDNAIGTLFGEEIFVIRCINTAIALSIALLKFDNLAFSRIGTHDVEIFFGRIRLLSFFNYTYENALRSAINSIIFNRNCNEIGYIYKIRERINESGAFIQKNILLNSNNGKFNFDSITDTIINFLNRKNMSEKQLIDFRNQIKEYTAFSQNTIKISHQSVYSGTSPHYRQVTSNYENKILHQSDNESSETFVNFYSPKKKNHNSKSNNFSMIQWFKNILKIVKMTQIINEPIDFFKLLKFDEKINKFTKKKIIGWLNGMILLLVSCNKDTNQMKIEDEEAKEHKIKIIIDNVNDLLKEFIEHRSNRFKQTIDEYVRERLFIDLNVILQIVQNNFQNDLSNAIKEIEHKSILANDDDDIVQNIYDFSISIPSEDQSDYDFDTEYDNDDDDY